MICPFHLWRQLLTKVGSTNRTDPSQKPRHGQAKTSSQKIGCLKPAYDCLVCHALLPKQLVRIFDHFQILAAQIITLCKTLFFFNMNGPRFSSNLKYNLSTKNSYRIRIIFLKPAPLIITFRGPGCSKEKYNHFLIHPMVFLRKSIIFPLSLGNYTHARTHTRMCKLNEQRG